MKKISILNHVLGPVMRGPSSSHTAGAFHIASMARSLLDQEPARAVFAFDTGGSYGQTYVTQGADRAFVMGLLNRPLTDSTFFRAREVAEEQGLEIRYEVRALKAPDHPNTVEIELEGKEGRILRLVARSIGGGEVEIVQIDGHSVLLDGSSYEVLVFCTSDFAQEIADGLGSDGALLCKPTIQRPGEGGIAAVMAQRSALLGAQARRSIESLASQSRIHESKPVYLVATGSPLFTSAEEMVALCERRSVSLGRLALEYESTLLGMSETDVLAEVLRRWDIMKASVEEGLAPDFRGLQLSSASAGSIFQAEAAGSLALGGPHARAAARAMAVMHVDSAMGVVCAAPTGGSAGAIPGAFLTLAEERVLPGETIALALLAAGAVGLIVSRRSTFAAEVAGCQVEIGAAGAMAAAGIIDAVGGTAAQAAHAAAIVFQNTMGNVCDLIHGLVEIPCHTRNAAAAASAFVVADLVLGGYKNPIPLDETIDAVHAVGLAMPAELRCTSRGGLAVTPSALNLLPSCCGKGCC